MKVQCAASSAPGKWRSVRTRHVAQLCLVALGLGGLLTYGALIAKETISEWAYAHGHHRYDKTTDFFEVIWSIPSRSGRSVSVPHLAIDVKFRHMQKIYAKRDHALAQGLLETDEDDLVPGTITVGGKTSNIKLRLKGDFTDHLEGRKWSFRIHIDGGESEHVLGMRRFSIQNPNTKGYHGEALVFSMLRDLGVVAPRYLFVTATLNGDDLGVMALEEHFSKELLENNGRRESVIVKFDEQLLFHGLDDYRTAPVIPFRKGQIDKSEVLQRDFATASGLMRALVDGTLEPSEVFVVEELAAFLAVVELWGPWHPIRWHNMRFYFDPVAARLGPVAFDINLQQRRPIGTIVSPAEPVIARMLEDPVVFAAYREHLSKLCLEVVDGDVIERLQAEGRRHVETLQTEFFLLEDFDYNELIQRAEFHLGVSEEVLRSPGILEKHPLLVRSYVVASPHGTTLELINAVPHEVHVHAMRWVSDDGSQEATLRPLQPLVFPLRLPAKSTRAQIETLRVPVEPPPISTLSTAEIQAALVGVDERQHIRSVPRILPLTRHPVPTASVAEQLAAHEFLSLDELTGTLVVKAGTWNVSNDLIVPKGHDLSVPPGTSLRFAYDAALVAHGPLLFLGTEAEPILLEAMDEGIARSWQGIAVLDAPGPSVLHHVVVRDTRGIDMPGWSLTGAVTFHRSEVALTDMRFEGSDAEDALNIVRSKFELQNVLFSDTASDAFDADFAQGKVVQGEFRNIGGDALDVSGSSVEVDGTRFVDVRDKALSVGEGSTMTARRVLIERALVGAVCKDGSVLQLVESSIHNPTFAGVAAYIKKPEYGPAVIRAENLSYVGNAPKAKAQTGSSVTIDGAEIPTEDIDVEALYETVMSKDGGR